MQIKKEILCVLLLALTAFCIAEENRIISFHLSPKNSKPISICEYTFDNDGWIQEIITYSYPATKWGETEFDFDPKNFYIWDNLKDTFPRKTIYKFIYDRENSTITKLITTDSETTVERVFNINGPYDYTGGTQYWDTVFSSYYKEYIFTQRQFSNGYSYIWNIDFKPNEFLYLYDPETNTAKSKFEIEFDGKKVYKIIEPSVDGIVQESVYVSNTINFSSEAAFFNSIVLNSRDLLPFITQPTIKPNKITFTSKQGEIIWQKNVLLKKRNDSKLIINEEYISKDEYGMTYLYDNAGKKIGMMLLSSQFMMYYDKDLKNPTFMGTSNGTSVFSPENINATSHLTERSADYLPENIATIQLALPWVENTKGNGIGERISFSKKNASGMYLINGYISMDRPDLFEKNSRIQQVIIRDTKMDYIQYEYIIDIAKPQYIDLQKFTSDIVEIEISAVYPGTLYEDTCLAGIVLVE